MIFVPITFMILFNFVVGLWIYGTIKEWKEIGKFEFFLQAITIICSCYIIYSTAITTLLY